MSKERSSPDSIIEREARAVMQTYKRLPVVIESGRGCRVFDTNGKSYLDLFAGVAVNTLGHAHPRLVSAIAGQAAKLIHVSNLLYNEPMVELAERLAALSGMDRVFFCNSGTEANEAAIKIARKWGKKTRGKECFRILTFDRAFHGRTLGALTATGNPKYGDPFEPLLPGFVKLPFLPLEEIATTLDGSFCAVMIEPVQGEGGVWPIDPRFLQGLRKICGEKKILLVADEVQTGIGRTGRWFGFQHSGVKPDLAPLAKGLGGGFPIGACLASGGAAAILEPGDHGSTFAGSALAARTALAVLEVIEDDGLLRHTEQMGGLFRTELEKLCREFAIVDHVRGLGLMLALELKEPVAREIVQRGIDRGVLFNSVSDTALRFVPPLVISEAEIMEAVQILRSILQDCASR
jgi:predicted acetylornithine/succinylornithine family transaminase